jgi:hypothetical protein
LILTSSSLFNFLQCEYKYFLKQVLGLVPKSMPDYINLGLLTHDGFEEYWKTGSKQEAASYIKNRCKVHYQEAAGMQRTDRLEIAEATARAMVMYNPWNIEKMTEAERIFETQPKDVGIDLPDGWVFAGKRDGKFPDGRDIIVRDYKTTSKMNAYTDYDQMKMNFQASFYIFMDPDPAVKGCEFCLIRRTQIRQKKKPPEPLWKYLKRIDDEYRTRTSYYYCKYTTFRDRREDPFIADLQKTVDRLVYCMENAGNWQKQAPACAGWGSGCEYLPICTGKVNAKEFYDQVGPDCHPELGIKNGVKEDASTDGEDGNNEECSGVDLLHLRRTENREDGTRKQDG